MCTTSWRYSMPSVEHLYRWSVVSIEGKNHKKSTSDIELFELAGIPPLPRRYTITYKPFI